MVIDSNNGIKPGNINSNTGRSQGASGAERATEKSGGSQSHASQDSVVISREAQSMNRLADTISELPDIDSERVASLKQAIAEGRFEIDADRIAENMLNQDDLLS